MVFFGFSTDSAGAVADSTPINPQRVSKAAALITLKVESGVGLKGTKCALLKKNKPATGTNSNGSNLSNVKMNSIRPADWTPDKFKPVITKRMVICSARLEIGCRSPKMGVK